MKKVATFIKNNKLAQFAIVFIAGLILGAVFYPTQHIEERVKTEYQEKIDKEVVEKEKIRQELTDELNKEVKEHSETKLEMTIKINKLETKVTELNAKKKETYYKIVKPDGTIEIKQYSESEVSQTTKIITQVREEFDIKIKSIADKWQEIHKKRVEIIKKDFDKRETEYKETIKKLESEKIVDINPKSFGLEIGYTSKLDYYSHITYDIAGPIFIGVHTESDFKTDFAVGAGLGWRF